MARLVQNTTLRLNHNANPLGTPPRARAAILEAMEDVPHYPGPRRGTLRARLAELHDVSADQVVLGSGSTEVVRTAIQAHASPQSRILQADPTYEDAIRYGEPFPYRIEQVPLTSEFAHDVERMRGLADGWREPTVVYICNPNNPTGTLTPSAEVDDWISSASDNVFFIVDEAYFAFVDDANYWSAQKWARERSNVVVTRTFSKLYGMAGLRIGYGLCHAETARRLNLYATHSNPNTLAMAAALGALEEEGWQEKSLRTWDQCKEVVTTCLDELGLHYFQRPDRVPVPRDPRRPDPLHPSNGGPRDSGGTTVPADALSQPTLALRHARGVGPVRRGPADVPKEGLGLDLLERRGSGLVRVRSGEKSCVSGISCVSVVLTGGRDHGCVLRQVQVEEGDPRGPEGHHEERAPGHEGKVPALRDRALPDSALVLISARKRSAPTTAANSGFKTKGVLAGR